MVFKVPVRWGALVLCQPLSTVPYIAASQAKPTLHIQGQLCVQRIAAHSISHFTVILIHPEHPSRASVSWDASAALRRTGLYTAACLQHVMRRFAGRPTIIILVQTCELGEFSDMR